MIEMPRRAQGFRSNTVERPYNVQDPQKHLNEMAVLLSQPRQPVLIMSFSNPQARIVAEGYRFMWWQGERMIEGNDPKLTFPVLARAGQLFHNFAVLADTDLVIDEAVLIKGQDVQIANFSFRDRFMTLHRPDYHLEWTEGTPVIHRNILTPEALG